MNTILRYELRIGVTGHRKLADSAEMAEAVQRLLAQMEQTLSWAAEFPEGPAGSPRTCWQKCERRLAWIAARRQGRHRGIPPAMNQSRRVV